MAVGGMAGNFIVDDMRDWIPVFPRLAAASMTYGAMPDLSPGLQKETELTATVQQVLFIGRGRGRGGIFLVRNLAGAA
jgi:hypothetical protein